MNSYKAKIIAGTLKVPASIGVSLRYGSASRGGPCARPSALSAG